ncbi:hypothetical protein [Inquilinus limosus]|uniref:Uncharacterized protein n=1 Tax=Inquilinus limosus TaxID=171674 RepID=A0A211ZL54_9PROT|nr:hypothetical protein [Inquilinus limosus]OWJ65980.1 hypothetical protein BWR60_17330 [Inquilinus limosus]
MRPARQRPAAFRRFEAMGGVLDFAVFEESLGTEEELFEAIAAALGRRTSFDADRLQSLGRRRIDERLFFGDWLNHESGALLQLGSYTTADGRRLRNPTLLALERTSIRSGAGEIPEAGAGGQFAYAFSHPPYSLRAKPRQVQAVFDVIRCFILPPGHDGEILDWSSPRLPEVSDYFEAGMEWWGVFLFSIHIPALRRLTVIAGSTTD